MSEKTETDPRLGFEEAYPMEAGTGSATALPGVAAVLDLHARYAAQMNFVQSYLRTGEVAMLTTNSAQVFSEK